MFFQLALRWGSRVKLAGLSLSPSKLINCNMVTSGATEAGWTTREVELLQLENGTIIGQSSDKCEKIFRCKAREESDQIVNMKNGEESKLVECFTPSRPRT